MSLASEKLTQELAKAFKMAAQVHHYAGLQKGGVVRGTVIDVKDPENRGRVKVLFDAMNPKDIPQIEGAGSYSDEREGTDSANSHWIDASPSFVGKQPPGLVGKRVSIVLSNGQYHYAVLQDVVYDPQNLTPKAAGDLKQPDNNSLQRLPIYLKKDMPPPCAENHGCTVIEEDGPMDSDWLCVCLKRQGKYIWVRHVDLQHGHAGENDGKQPSDSDGDSEQPVAEQSVWDYVFPTSAKEMPKSSAYGTSPRPNPYGGKATWYPPPE